MKGNLIMECLALTDNGDIMKKFIKWKTAPAPLAAVLLAALLLFGQAGAAFGNGKEEEDEGDIHAPVELIVGKPHAGSVGGYGDSFYSIRATRSSHTIAVTGTPIVQWRLSSDRYLYKLLMWCKPEPSQSTASTKCQVKGMKVGVTYFLNVTSMDYRHTYYTIDVSTP